MLSCTGLTVDSVPLTKCSFCVVPLLCGEDTRNTVVVTQLPGGSILKTTIAKAVSEVQYSHSYKQHASR